MIFLVVFLLANASVIAVLAAFACRSLEVLP